MMRICKAWVVLVLLAYCGKSIDAHAHHHLHLAGGGHGGHAHARHLSQVAPGPSSGVAPPLKSVTLGNTTANITTALSLGRGFKDAIVALVKTVANNSLLANVSHCGTPIREEALTMARGMLLDVLSSAQASDGILSANLTNLRQWRSILNDKSWLLEHYADITAAAKEYFNISCPSDPLALINAFSKISASSTRRTLKQVTNAPSSSPSGPSSFVVPVYVVIVYDPVRLDGSTVTAASVAKQISVLNEGYKGTGFSFELTGDILQVKDTNFFLTGDGSVLDRQAKQNYRRGGPEALNVYIRAPSTPQEVVSEGRTLLGVSRFPEMLCVGGKMNEDRLNDDGATIWYATLPDQGQGFLGATLVHEVGHWLGLPHTFNAPSSCDDHPLAGDGFSQTAVEQFPYDQHPDYVPGTCDTSFDSCPDLPGTDPITNWMDYSPDSCYTGFTPDQISDMQASYYYIRKNKQCSIPADLSPFIVPIGQTPSGTPGGPTLGNPFNSATRSGSNSFQSLIIAFITALALLCSIY